MAHHPPRIDKYQDGALQNTSVSGSSDNVTTLGKKLWSALTEILLKA